MVIDYSKYDSKDKDQFYTPIKTSKYCYNKFCEIMKQFNENENEYEIKMNEFKKALPYHLREMNMKDLIKEFKFK